MPYHWIEYIRFVFQFYSVGIFTPKKRHKGSQEYNIKTSNVFCNISNCYIGHT